MAFSVIANVTCTVEKRRLPRNAHCLSAGSDSFYLQFQPTIWALSYPRKHINCTSSLQERHFPTPLRHTEKQQFYWNWTTLPLHSSSLQSPKFNVDKPTQWQVQGGPATFDLPAILQKRGYFRVTSNKMIYKTTDSQVFKLKKVYMFPNVKSVFSAKSFGLGNLSLLTNSQKLSNSL